MDILGFLVEAGVLAGGDGYGLTRLTGGLWNDVYRLEGNGRDWVIKHFRGANVAGLYPILPEAEALALDTLRGLDIAPEPIVFLPDGPLLVYEFFPGEVGQVEGLAVGRLLRRLHDVPVQPEGGTQQSRFRQLPLTPTAILEQGDGILAQATADALTEQLRHLRPKPKRQPPLARLSLVHTDTWAGNFVQNGRLERGRQLRLIDWQCPGLGDPAEDVWTFLHSGYEMLLDWPRFDEQLVAAFWAGYGDSAVRQRVSVLGPYYAYRIAAHCCLQHQALALDNTAVSINYRKVFDRLVSVIL